MGLLWLSTVPPTNSLVAIMFGTRHLGMLGGVVFLSHQIGSFLGVWLGGYLYDRFGTATTRSGGWAWRSASSRRSCTGRSSERPVERGLAVPAE